MASSHIRYKDPVGRNEGDAALILDEALWPAEFCWSNPPEFEDSLYLPYSTLEGLVPQVWVQTDGRDASDYKVSLSLDSAEIKQGPGQLSETVVYDTVSGSSAEREDVEYCAAVADYFSARKGKDLLDPNQLSEDDPVCPAGSSAGVVVYSDLWFRGESGWKDTGLIRELKRLPPTSITLKIALSDVSGIYDWVVHEALITIGFTDSRTSNGPRLQTLNQATTLNSVRHIVPAREPVPRPSMADLPQGANLRWTNEGSGDDPQMEFDPDNWPGAIDGSKTVGGTHQFIAYTPDDPDLIPEVELDLDGQDPDDYHVTVGLHGIRFENGMYLSEFSKCPSKEIKSWLADAIGGASVNREIPLMMGPGDLHIARFHDIGIRSTEGWRSFQKRGRYQGDGQKYPLAAVGAFPTDIYLEVTLFGKNEMGSPDGLKRIVQQAVVDFAFKAG